MNSQGLLDAFHLSTNETLESKNRRFREFVGLVIVAWKVSWGYTWNFFKQRGGLNLSRDFLGGSYYCLFINFLCVASICNLSFMTNLLHPYSLRCLAAVAACGGLHAMMLARTKALNSAARTP